MRDKMLHFAVSALIVITVARFAPLWASATVAFGLGIGKEVYDIRHGVASWKDLLADLMGVLYGLLICL